MLTTALHETDRVEWIREFDPENGFLGYDGVVAGAVMDPGFCWCGGAVRVREYAALLSRALSEDYVHIAYVYAERQ